MEIITLFIKKNKTGDICFKDNDWILKTKKNTFETFYKKAMEK